MLFLGGKQDQVIGRLKKKMDRTSQKLEFEKAALLRDQILSLERLIGEQTVVCASDTNQDVIAIARDGTNACAQVFFVRNGKLIGKEHFALDGTQDENQSNILSSFIQQFYSSRTDIPPRIIIESELHSEILIKQWLHQRAGRKVQLIIPKRGKKKQLLEMVSQNAIEMLQQLQFKWLSDSGKTAAALEELKTYLGLPRLPKRIECYDISSIQGTAAVGSMVVFENGQPKPSHYRRFRIKTITGIDDYAMMQEVIGRRFGNKKKATGNKSESFSIIPDLVMIDGGKGHLKAIHQLFAEMEIKAVPLAAIAKENEQIFTPENKSPIILPGNSQGFYLLQRVRDEAHRFAISYHTKIRQKGVFSSPLDQIPGIGPTRKNNLLKAFGSLKGIRTASTDEIAAVHGMNRSLAETVKDYL
jgi:excinuclease ABC subunit C